MFANVELDSVNDLFYIDEHLQEAFSQLKRDAKATILIEPNASTIHKKDKEDFAIDVLEQYGLVRKVSSEYPLDLIVEFKNNPKNKVIFENAGFIGKNGQNYDHLNTYKWNPERETKDEAISRARKAYSKKQGLLRVESTGSYMGYGDRKSENKDKAYFVSDTTFVLVPKKHFFDTTKVARPLRERLQDVLDLEHFEVVAFKIEAGAMVNLGLSRLAKAYNFNLASKFGEKTGMVVKRENLKGFKFPCIIVGLLGAQTYKSIHDHSRGGKKMEFWILFEKSEYNMARFEKVLSKRLQRIVQSDKTELSVEIETNLEWYEPIWCLNGSRNRNGSYTKNTGLNRVTNPEGSAFLGKVSAGSWEGLSPEENAPLVRFMASVVYANKHLKVVKDLEKQGKQFKESQIEFWQFFYAIFPEAYWEKVLEQAKRVEKELAFMKRMPDPSIHEKRAKELFSEYENMKRKQFKREKAWKHSKIKAEVSAEIEECLEDAKREYEAKFPIFGIDKEDNTSEFQTDEKGRPLIKDYYSSYEEFEYGDYFFALEEEILYSVEGLGVGISPSDAMAFRESWDYENEEEERKESFLWAWAKGFTNFKGEEKPPAEAEQEFFSSSSSPRKSLHRDSEEILSTLNRVWLGKLFKGCDSLGKWEKDFPTPKEELKTIRYSYQDSNPKKNLVVACVIHYHLWGIRYRIWTPCIVLFFRMPSSLDNFFL